jgi:predicted O-methyltransferase YrrM
MITNINEQLSFLLNICINTQDMEDLFKRKNIKNVLEIGSAEGSSACHFMDWMQKYKKDSGSLNLDCVDIWSAYKLSNEVTSQYSKEQIEHYIGIQEKNFDDNTSRMLEQCPDVRLSKNKSKALDYLCQHINDGELYDLIYVDGCHHSTDVLLDAQLSFPLLKVGGIMIFDDYTWKAPLPEGINPVYSPKMAIDTFTTLYFDETIILQEGGSRLFVEKIPKVQ